MSDWIERFEGLRGLEPRLKAQLVSQSRVASYRKGEMIFGVGRRPENMLLLLEGAVRVQQRGDSGREIVLYRVEAGESCVMTTACLLAYENYAAEGIAETDVRAAAIPRAVFDSMLERSRAFREFVFSAYSRRMVDLFQAIDELAFRRVDVRLAQALLRLSDENGRVSATHQQLAAELGTAREVVSRQLQDFQRRGLVALSRGAVDLTEREHLREIAASR